MFIGFIMLVIGVVVPFLMTIWVIQPSFLLGFISYFSSILGLVIGTIGAALYVRESQSEDYF
jgi:hypothetical protein